MDGGGGEGVLTRDAACCTVRLAEGGDGTTGGFLLAVCWVVAGGVSDREKETPPVLERVVGGSLSLEKSGGGGAPEG